MNVPHASFLPLPPDEAIEPFRVEGTMAVRSLVRELLATRALVALFAADDPDVFIVTRILSLEADSLELEFDGDADRRQALLDAPYLTVVGVPGSVKIQFRLENVEAVQVPGKSGPPGQHAAQRRCSGRRMARPASQCLPGATAGGGPGNGLHPAARQGRAGVHAYRHLGRRRGGHLGRREIRRHSAPGCAIAASKRKASYRSPAICAWCASMARTAASARRSQLRVRGHAAHGGPVRPVVCDGHREAGEKDDAAGPGDPASLGAARQALRSSHFRRHAFTSAAALAAASPASPWPDSASSPGSEGASSRSSPSSSTASALPARGHRCAARPRSSLLPHPVPSSLRVRSCA